MRYRSMEADEADALDSVEQGFSFAEVCERLCEWHASDVVAMRAAMLLKAWIQNHWIKELYWSNDD